MYEGLKDIEKLNLLQVKTSILQQKATSKKRYSVEEKEDLKVSITEICEVLGEVLADDTLGQEFRERLENETRKQMVLIKKALDELQGIIRVSKSVLE